MAGMIERFVGKGSNGGGGSRFQRTEGPERLFPATLSADGMG